MQIGRLRDRIAAALGLATFACDPPPPPIVVAPISTTPVELDAALPKAPGKVLDLPVIAQCFDAIHYQCEKSLVQAPDQHYGFPFATCRAAPNFSATHTKAIREKGDEKCCYVECYKMEVEGRPLRADDRSIRIAPHADRTCWHTEEARVLVEPSSELSARWLKAALAEHASIAAFSQISLQLLALGAPSSLIEGTHRAALDEVRHAQISFTLASAYASGAALGPSRLSLAGVSTVQSLRDVAIDALIDGCVGEAASALAMMDDADRESNPNVATLIRNMASDEEGHATLAWRVVQWALSLDAQLLPSLVETLDHIALGSGRQAQVAREVASPILQRLPSASLTPESCLEGAAGQPNAATIA